MIVMKDVTKTYDMGSTQVFAMNGVNLEVEEGDFLAVMGPSGSGKSTLLYTIGALLTPTKGDVTIDGKSIYKMKPRQRAKFRRENVGFIFQTFELIPYLTALENVMLPLYLSGVAMSKHEDIAEEALHKVGLTDRAFHKPAELSGGEQQRVSIARGIANKPHILLADEPTGNLDQKTGNEIIQLLQTLRDRDELTVIMVTHDPDNARRSNNVLVMIDGRIVEDEGRIYPPRAGGEKNR